MNNNYNNSNNQIFKLNKKKFLLGRRNKHRKDNRNYNYNNNHNSCKTNN